MPSDLGKKKTTYQGPHCVPSPPPAIAPALSRTAVFLQGEIRCGWEPRLQGETPALEPERVVYQPHASCSPPRCLHRSSVKRWGCCEIMYVKCVEKARSVVSVSAAWVSPGAAAVGRRSLPVVLLWPLLLPLLLFLVILLLISLLLLLLLKTSSKSY